MRSSEKKYNSTNTHFEAVHAHTHGTHGGIIITSCDSHDVRCCHSYNFTNEIVLLALRLFSPRPPLTKSVKASQNLMRKHIFIPMEIILYHTTIFYMQYAYSTTLDHVICFFFIAFSSSSFFSTCLIDTFPHSIKSFLLWWNYSHTISYKEFHRLRVNMKMNVCVLVH